MIQYLKVTLPDELETWRRQSKRSPQARTDFFETRFEMVSYDKPSEISLAVFDSISHWRFGMEYERLSKSHTYVCPRSMSWSIMTLAMRICSKAMSLWTKSWSCLMSLGTPIF